MVKSRNQRILDLTIPWTEKSVYKVPSQREAWGSLPSFWESLFYLINLKRVLGEHFPKRKKENWSRPDILARKPYLRSSKLLACWNHLGGIQIQLGLVMGHGWVEHGSSQVIRSSDTEVRDYLWIVNAGYLSVQVSAIKGASIYRYEALACLFHFLE